MVSSYLLGRQMAVVIDDGLTGGVAMIEVASDVGFEQKIVIEQHGSLVLRSWLELLLEGLEPELGQ